MNFRSTQSFLAWYETAESLNMFLIGISTGAIFSYSFGSDIVWHTALLLSLPFSYMVFKNRAKVRDTKFKEQLDALRYRGLYPSEGEGNDDNVKNLKDAGYKGYAWRLHRELHGTSLRETRDAVNAL